MPKEFHFNALVLLTDGMNTSNDSYPSVRPLHLLLGHPGAGTSPSIPTSSHPTSDSPHTMPSLQSATLSPTVYFALTVHDLHA